MVSERQRRGDHPEGITAGDRPADRWEANEHARHAIHAGVFESSGTALQNCRATVPAGTEQVSRQGAGAVKDTAF